MSTVDTMRICKCIPLGWYARVCGYTILATALGLFFSSVSYAQAESETVEFDIPASTLPQALREFARQSRVELVFAERGYDDVRTQAVIGSFQRERALEMLLAGTGLRVGYGSGDSVIVQRAEATGAAAGYSVGQLDAADTILLAQAAVNGSRRVGADSEVANSQTISLIDEGATAGRSEEFEEITVTGSRIRGAQSASPIITISREEIDQAGFATVEDIVENLPQNFGAGATLDNSNFRNSLEAVGGDVRDFAGGASVNLRGLGSSSTLVLVNGRRMSPSGFEARFTDISSIPVTAIARVEVMTDGASAIYGSDAIAGVINFILRDDYEGAETRVRYGSDSAGDAPNVIFGQSFGKAWGSGNILFSYEYYDSEPLASQDRAFTASSDLSTFGGTDRRQPGGNPANIRVGGFFGDYYAIPAGQDGTSLTTADFDLSVPRNLYNERSGIEITPAQERHSAFLHLNQTVGSVELFGRARFSGSDSERRFNSITIDLNVPGDDPATPGIVEGNPFFVDPTGTGLTTVRVDNYAPESVFGPRISVGEIESTGATVGARFALSGNWNGEFVGNWSNEDATRWFANVVDRGALIAAVNQTDPGLAFNPFGDGSSINPAVLASIVDPSRVFADASENELWSVSFNVDGDVFDTAGGAAKIATGIDFREESLSSNTEQTGAVVDLNRDVLAVYAELFVPLVSNANRRTGLQRLEISLAARYEDYSDFGDSINPKLGILWSPTKSLAVRGTIGTSYRAPALVDLDDANSTSFRYFASGFAGSPDDVLLLDGNNPNLQPEEATTWTAGIQWRPTGLDGLSVDVTYFNVEFEDRIERPTLNAFGAVTDPRFASIVTFDPTPEQIAELVSDPNYLPDLFGFGDTAESLISGDTPLGAIVDNRKTNLAQSVVTGAELQLSYGVQTELGAFNIGLNGSYLFD
ncbi:MAG: TonB-dependent receptor, partial [Pseudomonadota bacterium]